MAGGTWTQFAPRVAVSDHEHGEFVRLLIGAAPAATDYFDGKGATSFYVPKTDTVNWVALGKSDGERFVLSVFQQALRGGTMCGRIGRKLREPAGSEHLPDVLDVGANEGFFGFLAAAWGCRAYLFEPQPACIAGLREAVALNQFQNLTTIVPQPVAQRLFRMWVDSNATSCFGAFPQHTRSEEHTSELQSR